MATKAEAQAHLCATHVLDCTVFLGRRGLGLFEESAACIAGPHSHWHVTLDGGRGAHSGARWTFMPSRLPVPFSFLTMGAFCEAGLFWLVALASGALSLPAQVAS